LRHERALRYHYRMIEQAGTTWTMATGILRATVRLGADGVPVLAGLRLDGPGSTEWAPKNGAPLAPRVDIGGKTGMRCIGVRAAPGEETLVFSWEHETGVVVRHHLQASRSNPVIRSRVVLENRGTAGVEGIRRFDALTMALGASDAEPEASYVLGWLDIPRIEAPGRPPHAFSFGNWLDKLLYEGAPPVTPPLPEAGWSAPTMRLITERLVRLPLRSGKRGTYDNFPWVAVRDPDRDGGFFAGFEWSGTWAMDIEHRPADRSIGVCARTDGTVHDLAPGGTLESPPAFLGLFSGDWDAAANASRRYSREEIIPKPPRDFPFVHYVFFPGVLQTPELKNLYFGEYGSDSRRRVRELVDAAADLGAESFLLDACWWDTHPGAGDFSIGLGDWRESRIRFPEGMKALSDHVHAKGMVFGMWFEFERVDLRTANTGRNPWKSEWIMHQNGLPYRSWGQHFYMLCLGHRPAADWVLESLSQAIREYGVDWFMIDSNEWAVCRDPTHTHGAGDGEWAQIQGLYHVLRGLRERFPKLIIDNGAGGAQRGDFGMARLCDVMPCSDINAPSVLNRQYSLGYGSFLPTYYARQAVYTYPTAVSGPVSKKDPYPWGSFNAIDWDPALTLERMEWRMINRMMGVFQPIWDLHLVPAGHLAALKRAIATYKRIRATLHGDRYVLAGPPVFVERENRESESWEAYEHLSLDRSLAAVFVFRTDSPLAEQRLRLKGLDPAQRYRIHRHSGRPGGDAGGAELMRDGFRCDLPARRSADVIILESRKEA
jgi:alpha-galactosidase